MRLIHEAHAAPVLRFLLRLTRGDQDLAEDLLQETMLRAWRHPAVLDEQHRSARSWLFTVAQRIVVDEWRSARARHELTVDEPPEQLQADQVDSMLDT